MTPPSDMLKRLIRRYSPHPIPKGELWLGTELFRCLGHEDTLDQHFRLADRLGHAVVCFSVAEAADGKPALGYRYFEFKDFKRHAQGFDRPVFAVVDGPFQELVNQAGLMQVLTRWIGDRDSLERAYGAEAEKTLSLISRILDLPVAALVIADDMSSDSGPLVRPSDIDALCRPFYTELVRRTDERQIPLLLHCCGNLTQLLPMFSAWRIQGFAAVQSRINDFSKLFRQFGNGIVVMGGIESDLLDGASFSETGIQALKRISAERGTAGDFILSSSCGLYKGEHLARIEKIYALVESAEL